MFLAKLFIGLTKMVRRLIKIKNAVKIEMMIDKVRMLRENTNIAARKSLSSIRISINSPPPKPGSPLIKIIRSSPLKSVMKASLIRTMPETSRRSNAASAMGMFSDPSMRMRRSFRCREICNAPALRKSSCSKSAMTRSPMVASRLKEAICAAARRSLSHVSLKFAMEGT